MFLYPLGELTNELYASESDGNVRIGGQDKQRLQYLRHHLHLFAVGTHIHTPYEQQMTR